MDESTPTRRSGRTRKANRKYTVDAFEGLDILSPGSESEAGVHLEDDCTDDGDFAIENPTDAPNDSEADDFSMAEGFGGSDRSGVATPVAELGDAMAVHDSGVPAKTAPGESSKKSRKHGALQMKTLSNTQSVRCRGLPDPTQHASKEALLSHLFGTGTEEIVNMARSRDKWASDPILPVRHANEHDAGGMCHSFSHTEEQRTMEATVGWDWYYNHGGKDRLTKRQKIRHLDPGEGLGYLPQPSKGSQSFLMGPYESQTLYTLEIGKARKLRDAWSFADGASEEADEQAESRKDGKEGWILNIGRKIHCMDWAPNQDGDVQLLALSTPGSAPEAQHKISQKPGAPLRAPAFAPAPPTPACIQIWAFSASTATGREGLLDLTRDPKLQTVICTEWGDAKQLKWCPTPRKVRDADSNGNIARGLLACLWGDGRVKVLDLRIETDLNSPTKYGEFCPPPTILDHNNKSLQSNVTRQHSTPGHQQRCAHVSPGFQAATSPSAARMASSPSTASPVLHLRTNLSRRTPNPLRPHPHSHPLRYHGSTNLCTRPISSPSSPATHPTPNSSLRPQWTATRA